MSEAKAQAAKQVPMPIREARIDKALARERLGLPLNALITFVMGGSQGSVFLNRLVPKAYQVLQAEAGNKVRHQSKDQLKHIVYHSSGKVWEVGLKEYLSQDSSYADYRVEGYVDSVLAWSAADIAITRAGMSTIPALSRCTPDHVTLSSSS
ncbi:MAG: glycosyltransferase [Deinococcales bacterium]